MNSEKGNPDAAKIIVFRGLGPHASESLPFQITQADLKKERELCSELHHTLSQLSEKRARIRRALEKHVPVEPGILSARLVARFRAGYAVEPGEWLELRVE